MNEIIDGRTKSYEDTSFVTGESPRVIDVFSDLGREATVGYIANDGTGTMLVAISYDGVNYGDNHTLYGGEILEFEDQSINKLKLTWVANTAYRIYLS